MRPTNPEAKNLSLTNSAESDSDDQPIHQDKHKNRFENRRLATKKQFIAAYPAFTMGGINALIFNRRQNGLEESGSILRLGRKLLIDIDLFFSWLDSLQSNRWVGPR